MTTLIRTAVLCVCLGAMGQAAAQIAANRYVDAQGVEVIVNRDAARTPDKAEIAGAPSKPADKGGLQPARLMLDPKLRISAAEQDRRDRDRVGILRQELEMEAGKYAALVQKTQPGAGKLSAAETQRLTEELYAHQKNIESLNAELRRVRLTQ